MVDAITAVLVVLVVFTIVASLLTVYVWRVDPHQFEGWIATLRTRTQGDDGSAP
jgi:hypothetical protein